MTASRVVAGNTLVQLVGKGITAGITFVITILIARTYGVSGFGEFTKITAFVSLFYLIVDFGMNAVWLRHAEIRNQRPETRKNITNFSFLTLLIARLGWGLVLIFIALSIVAFLPSFGDGTEGFTTVVKLGIIVLLPTLLTQGFYTTCNALFQKHLRYDRSVIAATIGSITTLSLVIILIKIASPLVVMLSSFLFGGVLLVLSSWILSRSYWLFKPLSVAELIPQVQHLFLRSFPLGITLLFNLIYFRADIFILTLYRTTEEVGIYGLATKVFEFPLTIPLFFMNAVYPLLLKSTVKEQRARIKRSLVFLTISSVGIAIAGFLFAPLMMLIKEEFVSSIVPFRILIISLPLFFVSNLYMWVLIMAGKRWQLVCLYGAGMLINGALNVIFIPRFGVTAAAVITGVSEAFILLLLLGAVRDVHKQQVAVVNSQKL